MDLIEEYRINICNMKLSNDDFGDKKKVKRANQFGERNREICALIEHKYPKLKIEFIELLDSSNEDLRGHVAHHIMEFMTVDRQIRLKALNVIKDVALNSQSATERYGNELWLKQYYKTHPEDLEE